ncbi:MAG: hypothetical protein HZA50_05850 [Planctomycetes bacterium]|nr:hypothetical protein [Planctomycetota bacterium]
MDQTVFTKKTALIVIVALAVMAVFFVFWKAYSPIRDSPLKMAPPLTTYASGGEKTQRRFQRADKVDDAAPLMPCGTNFEYYGWFAVHYTEPTPELKRIRQYTNTAFAVIPLQAKVLKELGFKHVVYSISFITQEIIDQLIEEAGGSIPEFTVKDPKSGKEYPSGVKDYAKGIPGFREKFFALYRPKLDTLKRSLEEIGALNVVDVFYLADEPALNRNIYLDQEFLDQIVAKFKQVFLGKKTVMVFSQNPGDPFPGTGKHLAAPPALDIVGVDPYFDPKKVSCDTESVRSWLYEKDPYTNINWAKQFKKPIIVIGDAQLRNGKAIGRFYPKATFDILKADKDVVGLIWYQYDKSYKEASDSGELSGAANDPELVRLIESMSVAQAATQKSVGR